MTIQTSALEALPREYRADIERAIEILKEGGCREIHVFGSVAEGQTRTGSDIDIAVRGCPPGSFFALLGSRTFVTNQDHLCPESDAQLSPALPHSEAKQELS